MHRQLFEHVLWFRPLHEVRENYEQVRKSEKEGKDTHRRCADGEHATAVVARQRDRDA